MVTRSTSSDRGIALGVGFTNACDLRCGHCYRATGEDRLATEDVLAAVDALPVRAVNFGTGENGLHPDFPGLVRALLSRGVDVTLTTNGASAAVLPDELLARLRDVEMSIDLPTEAEHDAARAPGNWALVEAQMRRCRALGVSTTVVSVLMRANAARMPDLVQLAASRGAALRVNVYQAVHGGDRSPSYEEFWAAWRALLGVAELVACGEPILRAVLGLPRPDDAGCGRSTVRLTPRGAVLPCVYAPDGGLRVPDLVRLGASIVDHPSFRPAAAPEACRGCPRLDTCGGGCPSRRALRGGAAPDEYCPLQHGDALPAPSPSPRGSVESRDEARRPIHGDQDGRMPEEPLSPRSGERGWGEGSVPFRLAPGRPMAKAASACTTIVRGRPGPRSADGHEARLPDGRVDREQGQLVDPRGRSDEPVRGVGRE